MVQELASFRSLRERVHARWDAFRARRLERLGQHGRFGTAAEKVAEDIVQDLFTEVLDWPLSDLNNQVGYADIVLSSNAIKYLIVETKRPGALAWHRPAVEAALGQARRYADEQKVDVVAVSDGFLLYAADVVHGGLRDRAFTRLDAERADHDELWWLSLQGIYRHRSDVSGAGLRLLPDAPATDRPDSSAPSDGAPLHPKYKVPARCFAYVGDATDTRTWKLPFRRADGSIDARRLPKAIQAILSNYRGAKVSSIPEPAIPDVLVRLAQAASDAGKMPSPGAPPAAAAYEQLARVLEQLGRTDEIG